MARLGSEFYKALDGYERPVIGYATLQQVVLLIGIGITVLVMAALIWFEAPQPLIYIISFGLLAPFVIYGCSLDEKIKDELRFLFTQQERTYQTDYDRKDYDKHAFLQSKENPETL